MRAGGGKQKGAAFERDICVSLSHWVSHGRREDLFWRSAMSGGRATVAGRRGVNLASQAGDISAVHKSGHALTGDHYFELKHVKDIALDAFIVKGTGPLATYWNTACREASRYVKDPILIVRQNRLPTLWISRTRVVDALHANQQPKQGRYLALVYAPGSKPCEIWLLDKVLNSSFEFGKPMKGSD